MSPLGARHPEISSLRRLLGRRSARHEAGRFVIEGPTLVAEAIRSGVELVAVYAEEGTEVPVGVDPTWVAPGVLERVLDTVTPRPVAAIAAIDVADPERVVADAMGRGRPLVVFDRLADPGNAGTILRSAEAAGAAGVVVTAETVDPWSPKVVRASAGSVLRVPVAPIGDLVALRTVIDGRFELIGAAAGRGDAHVEAPLAGAVGLVVGSEAHGLDPDAAVDRWVHIRMDGPVESLNAAMAATLLLFEAQRQRGN